MNILLGMCGLGARFVQAGYKIPKFLIVYHGAPMIYHSIETLKIPGKKYFIVLEQHLREYKFLEKMLLELGDEIIISKSYTRGAAETLLLAKPYIKNLDQPMISLNCDQYLSWNPSLLIEEMKANLETSYIVTYKETSEKCSYVREHNGRVVEVREKKVISNDATIGVYHWAHTKDFFNDAEQMINNNHRENNEYYVAPVYNYSISRGLDVKKFSVDQNNFWPVGTIDDLKYFKENNRGFD